MSKKNGGWLLRFVSGNGFYLVMILCVAAVAAAGYFLLFYEPEPQLPAVPEIKVSAAPTLPPAYLPDDFEASVEVAAIQSELVPPTRQPVTAAPTAEAVTTPEPAPGAVTTPAATPKPTVKSQSALLAVWPVNGSVITPFSREYPVYDKTNDDYRTHSGVDISASADAKVLAMSDGEVERVYEDPRYGMTVVIAHDNGLRTAYSNLSESPAVEENDTVKCGQEIGSIGETAQSEKGLGWHIHFVIYKDDEAIDPLSILPER